MAVTRTKQRHLVMLVCLLVFLLAVLPSASCRDSPVDTVVAQVDKIARPYTFDLWGWEARALINKATTSVREWSTPVACTEPSVVTYFNLSAEKGWILGNLGETEATRPRLEAINLEMMRLVSCVERVVEGQVSKALRDNGIGNPFGTWVKPAVFPPVLFRLEEPPKVLIISPREKIMIWHRVTLRQDLSLEQRMQIETACDQLGISSLVEDTGGMATYPSMVLGNTSVKYTLEIVIEEWVHQYLTFKPLGFNYLLDIWGVRRNPESASINETLAGMVSTELADMIYRAYHSGYDSTPRVKPTFDFNREMRATRIKIDELLDAGQVIAAEQFMEERRRIFIENGYYIRKLNQAYFAFHGTYGYNPASVSPAYADLQLLRSRSLSLADFLERAASVTSYAELRALISN